MPLAYLLRLSSYLVFFIFFTPLVSAAKLPLEYFASLPDIAQVQLSPDGQHVASIVRVKNDDSQGVVLSLTDLENRQQKSLLYASNEKFVINWIAWANNDKMLVSAVFPAVRYGTPTTETRLIIVDIHTNKNRSVLGKRQIENFGYVPQFQDRLVDMLTNEDDHFLLQLDGHSPGEPTVYKASLTKKRLSIVQRSRKNIVDWTTDRQNRVRVGQYFEGKHHKIKHRLPDSKKWKTLWEFDSFSPDQVWPMGFGQNPSHLYVKALYEGRDAIYLVDVNDPELKKTLIHANEHYDVNGSLFYSSVSNKVIGITAPDDGGYIFWDESYKKLYNGINKALPDTDNYFISFSKDENKYIILATSDTDSGTYYVGDRKKRTLDAIAFRYQNLDPKLMAEKRHVTYKARRPRH